MQNKITFVSGCDSNYFPMLLELIHSIRRFEQSKDMDICILDTGLTSEQVEYLKNRVTAVVNPDWPDGVPKHKLKNEYFKGCICRPFIPQIFPGYEVYLWLDADVWVQDWRSVELYIEGAKRNKLAITSQADRARFRQIRIKWLGALPLKIRGFYYSNARLAFGFKTAQKLLPYQILNAGSFALSDSAPHWKRWQELAVEATQKGKVFTAEQLSLGMITYLENYDVEILPAWTQWQFGQIPAWDSQSKTYVEKYLPHETIGIVHLCGLDKIRTDRSIKTEIKTLDGKTISQSLRYPYYDGEKVEEIAT